MRSWRHTPHCVRCGTGACSCSCSGVVTGAAVLTLGFQAIQSAALSVVRGLAIRSLGRPDPKRFRGLLDEWKALMSERVAGRSRNGKRAGLAFPMPTGRRP